MDVLIYHVFLLLVSLCRSTIAQVADLTSGTPVNEMRGFFKREHSLFKPYQSAGAQMPFWDIVGTTMITNNYVRLTPDDKSRLGGLWNNVPVRSRDWEMAINFKVHGSTGDMFGDGFAFWLTRTPRVVGDVFGSTDYFVGLGIFADTYSNHNGPHNHPHPYISAMVNNGSLHYDHDRDGTHTELAGCTSKFRNKDHDTQMLIRYVDDTIAVYHDIKNDGKWHKCFSVPGVRLPTGYYFGVTAMTGDLSDAHDIISLKMYEIDVSRPEKLHEVDRSQVEPHSEHMAAPRDHVPDAPAPTLGWGKTFLLFFAVAAFVAIGMFVYRSKQQQSSKRFY